MSLRRQQQHLSRAAPVNLHAYADDDDIGDCDCDDDGDGNVGSGPVSLGLLCSFDQSESDIAVDRIRREMINGKFYTGLPPKMVERQCGNGQNRQESHFFWPDDTQVDSSVETRVKRRGSLQLHSGPVTETTHQRQPATVEAAHDVDTRQMFHKEFTKSSIQFHDNLQPSGNNKNIGSASQSRLNRARREVTPKLTDVAPQQRPLLAIKEQANPSAARRNQAYSSKIEFYDYANLNEPDTLQNNARRPKMDMNNKREVELNSKNSPKLQVKHNVRHLGMEREQQPPQLRAVTKKPLNDGRHWERDQYEKGQEHPVQLPKKILKPQRSKHLQEGAEGVGESMLDFVDHGVHQLQLRSPAPTKKHVTYNEEAAEYAYYDDLPLPPDEGRQQPRQQLPQPNMRTGSAQHQHQQQHKQPRQTTPYGETGRDTKSLNNYNKNYNNNYDDYSNHHNSNHHKSSSNYNYSNGNYSNTSSNYNNSARSRKILPNLPESTTTTSARTMRSRRFDDTRSTAAEGEEPREETRAERVASTEPQSPPPSDPRKHLRSSLCFNGDALVVDVGAAAPSSSTAVGLARRSSAGQRISVGLPD